MIKEDIKYQTIPLVMVKTIVEALRWFRRWREVRLLFDSEDNKQILPASTQHEVHEGLV